MFKKLVKFYSRGMNYFKLIFGGWLKIYIEHYAPFRYI